MPDQYGIIGYPLAHSYSPAYFSKKFAELKIDANYRAFPITAITEFPTLVQSMPSLRGLSVTIPYKESVIPYLDSLDVAASEIGAVNCIAFIEGKTRGYNTDVIGFEKSLTKLLQPQHTSAYILGTGGSSKAVAWVLKKLGIPFQKISRNKTEGCLTYDDLSRDMIANTKLIINTTPLGQYPATDAAANIPYAGIGNEHLLFDLIYNPAETRFLQMGREQGATISNGLEMLQMQAEAAWEIWNRE